MENNHNNLPSDNNSPVMGQRITTQVQRISQFELITNNLDAGISPAMVTALTAVLAQIQSQEQMLPTGKYLYCNLRSLDESYFFL